MIPERIQRLYREAVFKTCVQGTRAGKTYNGVFICEYEAEDGKRCAVGHALPTHLLNKARGQELNVGALCMDQEDIALFLHAGDAEALEMWARLQTVHDWVEDGIREHYQDSTLRPFGVSWSAWFWYRARTLAKDSGFDIGNYPRKEVQDAQAA